MNLPIENHSCGSNECTSITNRRLAFHHSRKMKVENCTNNWTTTCNWPRPKQNWSERRHLSITTEANFGKRTCQGNEENENEKQGKQPIPEFSLWKEYNSEQLAAQKAQCTKGNWEGNMRSSDCHGTIYEVLRICIFAKKKTWYSYWKTRIHAWFTTLTDSS